MTNAIDKLRSGGHRGHRDNVSASDALEVSLEALDVADLLSDVVDLVLSVIDW